MKKYESLSMDLFQSFEISESLSVVGGTGGKTKYKETIIEQSKPSETSMGDVRIRTIKGKD